METSRVLACLSLTVCAIAASTARADDRGRARELFRQGAQFFKFGEYERALGAFKEAYRAYEDPKILFNIGQCYRQLNQKQEAIRLFRSYLHDLPGAPNAEEVRGVIQALD